VGLSNAASPNTLLTMPPGDAVVTAVYTNLSSPKLVFVPPNISGPPQIHFQVQGMASQPYVLQMSTDLLIWLPVSTNTTDVSGQYQWSFPVDPAIPKQFYRLTLP
jgi:hypothetical protein